MHTMMQPTQGEAVETCNPKSMSQAKNFKQSSAGAGISPD